MVLLYNRTRTQFILETVLNGQTFVIQVSTVPKELSITFFAFGFYDGGYFGSVY